MRVLHDWIRIDTEKNCQSYLTYHCTLYYDLLTTQNYLEQFGVFNPAKQHFFFLLVKQRAWDSYYNYAYCCLLLSFSLLFAVGTSVKLRTWLLKYKHLKTKSLWKNRKREFWKFEILRWFPIKEKPLVTSIMVLNTYKIK